MIRRAVNVLPILIMLTCLSTQVASAKSSDRNQRTNISADSNDCSLNESGACVFSGSVKITQGTLDIQAAKADLRRGGGEIRSVKLTGSPVHLKQQNDDGGWVNADATQIDYDLSNDTVVLTGNAHVQQPGKGSISGERIVYNMATSQVRSGGAAGGGRVNMIFEPKDKAATPSKTPSKSTPPAKPPVQDDK